MNRFVRSLFADHPGYKKRARLTAVLWTLLIFFLCFIPGYDLPEVHIPFVDKWVHFILFGIYSFLWLLSLRSAGMKQLVAVFVSSVILGWFVELVQGSLNFLHRSQDNMDTLADSFGGLLGVIIFFILYKWSLHGEA